MIERMVKILDKKNISCKNSPNEIVHLRFPDYRGGNNFWELFVNGNKEKRKVNAEQWGEIELKPFTFAIFWNGWLAGLMTLFGGEMAVGEGANKESFLKSLELCPNCQKGKK